jgi:pimeloyl-ACP methyl ester carboxylesterase
MTLPINEEELFLEAEGLRLPAKLTGPVEGKPRWGVVIIPGSMASDVDGNYPETHSNPHMYADLAHQLAARGHTVLRYAKEGAGTGSVVLDEAASLAHPIFSKQQYIAAAAAQKLRELAPEIAGLALAGHSEGSVHGMVVAQWPQVRPDAFISLSGPGTRYFDLFFGWADSQPGDSISLGPVKMLKTTYKKIFEVLRTGEELPGEIANDPSYANSFGRMGNDPRGKQYMRDYDAVDPAQEIARVPCPVLIVQGGLDASAVQSSNADKLLAARQAVDPAARLAFFPDLQHFYKRTTPDASPMESLGISAESDPAVAGAVSDWLAGLK